MAAELTAPVRDALHEAPGTAPGHLPVRPGAAAPRVTVLAYAPHELTEHTADDLEMVAAMRGKWPVLWVNVDGVAHAGTVRRLGEIFCLHRLALEDVMQVPQRAKADAYDDHLFVVLRMARRVPELDLEQIGVFVGPDFVLTFQERPGDPLEPVRERIRAGHARIRASGPDYLAYAILDAIVDHYFPVLEAYADELDALEDEITERPGPSCMTRLHRIKRDLMALRRAIWPLREALSRLVREPAPPLREETGVYLRDCEDHAFQILDLVETYREVASSLTELYLSAVGTRTNDIMKVLTLFASIFIPLGFITGIYGMNVEHAPGWWWSFPVVMIEMAVAALLLVAYFWRKGWIGQR